MHCLNLRTVPPIFYGIGAVGLFPHDLARFPPSRPFALAQSRPYIDFHARALDPSPSGCTRPPAQRVARINSDPIPSFCTDNAVVRPIYTWQEAGDIWTRSDAGSGRGRVLIKRCASTKVTPRTIWSALVRTPTARHACHPQYAAPAAGVVNAVSPP